MTRQQETRKLISIEKRSAQILVLFLLVSLWFQSWEISFGLILGGAVAILNFHWLWRIMEKVFFDRKLLHSLQALIKFIALVLMIFLILRFAGVDAIAFIVGISTLLLGILYEVIRGSLRAERGDS
ncbi:MAG: ATP synthase subunit I [Deltaproteobacteria bacterium]|nr:ATP synthase subunit I [Deltaproteobacteria bacterium]